METVLLKHYMTKSTLSLFPKLTFTDEDRSYHSHDFFEIFYILEGNIVHNSNNQKRERLSAGDAVLLRKSDKHCFIRENNTPCVHRDIIISEDQFVKACNFIDSGLFKKIISRGEPLRSKISMEKIAEFENCFTELSYFSGDEQSDYRSALYNILTVNLINVFLSEFRQQSDTNKYPTWFKNMLQRFKIPPLMQKGLGAILEQTNYDKSYICRTFKKYMNMSMSKYLLEVRLDYAATLLQITNNTVSDICEQIGIDSYPYFTVSFKKKFGYTPREFREIHK